MKPLFIIAGPCVIESQMLCEEIAGSLKETTTVLGMDYIFKASFDKANRTKRTSFRGPGIEEGLKILEHIRGTFAVRVLTDVHESTPLAEVASVVDVLQTPAMLCRQTDFITAVASQGKPVNIKKGQFLAPDDMRHVMDKAASAGNPDLMVCERGTCFGHHDLVVDFRGIDTLAKLGYPVVFDATHSVQHPGAGGDRRFVPVLARAAVAAGVDGVFMEVHPDPDNALSDGPNSLALGYVKVLLSRLKRIHAATL